jgi:putative sterol carrier protein
LTTTTIEDLEAELYRRFRPEAAAGVDMLIRLSVSEHASLLLNLRDRTLAITKDSRAPDVTFLFDDMATAHAIIRGEADAIGAFMNGKFRADGYLMMAFKLMEIFGSRSLPPTPRD